MSHWHKCPECYETYQCDEDCSIAWEDEDDGRAFGSYTLCDDCGRANAPTDLESLVDWYKVEAQRKHPSQSWWDIYHGIRRK
jgi:hypothetical protein